MTVITKPFFEQLDPLVNLRVHQIALKQFDYHAQAVFPYNLLILVITRHGKAGSDYFRNCETGQRVNLKVNHAYILPCHLPVQYERTPAYTVVTIRFNMTYFYGRDVFAGSRRIEDRYDPDLVAIASKIAHQRRPETIKTVFTLRSAIMQFCLACWPKQLTEVPPNVWKYENAFSHVQKNINAKLTVAELASIYDLRQDVFSRAFSRDVGIAPKKYIDSELTKRIASHLLSSDMKIKQIARELDFSSEHYLSRFFKKNTGLSPREYRSKFGAE